MFSLLALISCTSAVIICGDNNAEKVLEKILGTKQSGAHSDVQTLMTTPEEKKTIIPQPPKSENQNFTNKDSQSYQSTKAQAPLTIMELKKKNEIAEEGLLKVQKQAFSIVQNMRQNTAKCMELCRNSNKIRETIIINDRLKNILIAREKKLEEMVGSEKEDIILRYTKELEQKRLGTI